MTSEMLACPDCTTDYALGDNYCRKCGMFLAALRDLPVVTQRVEPPALLPRQRAGLPAPVRKAATALAIGTAIQLGAGIAGKVLAAQGARGAVRAAAAPSKAIDVAQPKPEPLPETMAATTEVSETLMIRRVWIRRGQ